MDHEQDIQHNTQPNGFVIQPRLHFDKIQDKITYLYFMDQANFSASEQCDRGQLIISVYKLAEEIGWSEKVLRGAIKRLEKKGLISCRRLPRKRGTLVTVQEYSELQKLDHYSKKGEQKGEEKGEEKGERKGEQGESEIPSRSKVKPLEENGKGEQKGEEKGEEKGERKGDTITAFITSLNSINSNRTLKEYLDDAKADEVKNMNLENEQDIQTFVEFAMQINVLPPGTSAKILRTYINTIRLTRATCTISANIVQQVMDKMSKYSADQLNYAMWLHFDSHDDKKEKYTIGILRNTTDPEAKRGLMKLKNKNGGVDHASDAGSSEQKYEYGF